ncbi:MAG: hypothetical protein R3281_13855, partial [Balneolaceae bacterium]|nr:hypothetical protein [Balneolaceae bacterium]
MITYRRFFITALLLVFGPVSLFVADRTNRGTEIDIEFPEAQPTVGSLQGLEDHEVSRKEMNAQRADYFFRLLRDPDINAIPENIRSRELNHARRQPTRIQHPLRIKQKDGTLATAEYTWASAGPTDVGGRTRALGIDSRDPDIILAGGVSGGMWKSVDGGRSWDLKTDPSQNQSVTSLAQDPTDPDTWYYTSGELRGQSAADRGNRSFYWGDGVYKSTDNGDSWRLLPNASSDEDFRVDKFNTISRIVISPATGSIFIASNGFGIYRSTDDGGSFPSPPLLGARGEQYWADIDVARDGRLIATLSERTFGSGGTSYTPGVFASYDDGDSWINVTPATFPDNHERSVVAFAPSAPDTAYVLTYVSGTGADEDIRFHMIDLNNLQNGGTVQSDDRSLNLPDFGESVGYMSTQQNYNMVVAVKPDDPEFVLVGGINLFRSEDGFATAPRDTDNDGVDNDSEKDAFWVGGYAKPNNVSQYPGQHADQHVVVFQPGNTGVAWTGHDGGLSRTDDITAPAVEWDNMDRGYITTQFYSADIPDNPSDQRLLGGTQDNGSPFFSYNSQTNSADGASDLSSGDGGYAYFTNSYLYVSRQNGDIIQYLTGAEGELTSPPYFAFVHPKEAEDQFFVHPYAVDPTDENIMYYPDQRRLWRNTSLSSIDRNNDPDGITQGWESFNAVIGAAYAITALEVTTRPSDILYYGASAEQMPPKIYRLENASSSTSPAEVSIPGAPDGAYVHDFAINPAGGDELMVIFSNYGIPSIYYTQDGGQTWTDVEGNLAGDGTSSDAGPSIRSGLIIPAENGTIY